MKLRKLFLTLFILIATAMLAIFIYELLSADNIIEVTANHNIVVNNQISVRDVKSVTSNISSMPNNTNSTISFGDSQDVNSPVSWILAVSVCGTLLLGLGIYAILYYNGLGCVTDFTPGEINQDIDMEFLA